MDYTAKALELIRSCNGVGGALWVASVTSKDTLDSGFYDRIKELALVNSGPVVMRMDYFTREIIFHSKDVVIERS